ncbi:MAG TPA: BsaWI family type II restriction enzyme [Salinivirgaceae bacterium]|nr:BsaWI family type II restriction enzyme [Salinivirgaceae bacterium]HQA76141.1 BsaWI family type II restriction enzyme [Salinivirgaceae bacterium]
MKFIELQKLYDKKKTLYGRNAYRHIPEVLKEAKVLHKKEFKGNNHERSWRIFMGRNLAKLIEYAITNKVKNMGLDIVSCNTLNRLEITTKSIKLGRVKRYLAIDYGEDNGCRLPDVDIVIFNPKNYETIAVLSVNVTLRERVSPTDWERRLAADKFTEYVKVYFLSLYKIAASSKNNTSKHRKDLIESNLEDDYPVEKVKKLDKLILELQVILLAN